MVKRIWYCYSCKTGVIHNSKELLNSDAGNIEPVWICSDCSRCLNEDGGDEYCQKLLDEAVQPAKE